MRTLSALFGLSIIVVAIAMGWWSPVEREALSPQVAAVQERPGIEEAAPLASSSMPSSTVSVTPEPVAEEPQEIEGEVFYTTANVRMRSGPASSFNIVWTAPAGTRVHSVQIDGNWHLVKTADHEGWMYVRYMREGSATQ